MRGDRHDGPILRPAAELQIRPSRSRGRRRHPDLGQDLIGLERAGECAHEEIAGLDHPAAVRTHHVELCIQSEQTGGVVAAGVGVGGRAPHGAPVADLRVTDLAGGAGQERELLLDQVGELDVVMRGQRPEGDVPVGPADVVEVLHPADVHHE